MTGITIVGKKHEWFDIDGQEGARCALIRDAPLQLVIFDRVWRGDDDPMVSKVSLRMLLYHRSIFFCLKVDKHFYAMPYFHAPGFHDAPGDEIPPTPDEGLGLLTSFALCDDSGICKSLAVRSLSYEFTIRFLDAAREQVSTGLTLAEHDRNIANASALWKNYKIMFMAASGVEMVWPGISGSGEAGSV